MEVYINETREIIRRFQNHTLCYPGCIAALDAALAGFVPQMVCGQLPQLRSLLLANNEIVVKELETRAFRVLPAPTGLSSGVTEPRL